MQRHYFVSICLALVLAACTSPSASQHPNFTGEWILDKANSNIEIFDIANLESGSIAIDHREPNFKFDRTFTMVDGRKTRASYDLTTDGKEVTLSSLGLGTYAALSWEGEALALALRVGGAEGDSTESVHYRLTAGGSRLEADEDVRTPSRNYKDHWVLTKK